jgi:hypothetical protein
VVWLIYTWAGCRTTFFHKFLFHGNSCSWFTRCFLYVFIGVFFDLWKSSLSYVEPGLSPLACLHIKLSIIFLLLLLRPCHPVLCVPNDDGSETADDHNCCQQLQE